MEHFPLAICHFQTTFFKTRIKATEVSILAPSVWSFETNDNSIDFPNGNWRYGKTWEFRVQIAGMFYQNHNTELEKLTVIAFGCTEKTQQESWFLQFINIIIVFIEWPISIYIQKLNRKTLIFWKITSDTLAMFPR
jgi:hypothetical protein